MEPSVTPPHTQEPAQLRLLRRLVTALTVVMILGIVMIVGLLFWRLSQPGGPDLPTEITVPAGEVVQSVSTGAGWIYVVTDDGTGQQRVHLVREGGQTIHQTIEIRSDQR